VRELSTEHPLPRPFVEFANLFEQANPIAVLEIEQRVERPVQVVRQVGDLLPDLVEVVPS
jgi:hypothetical protein